MMVSGSASPLQRSGATGILIYTPRGHNCGFLKVFNALYCKGLMCLSFPHP